MECRAPKELVEFILQEAAKDGYEVVDIATKGGGTFHVEVVLDKNGKITIGECGEFNRKVTSWIDEQQMFMKGYVIDVCSPGLDREIKSESEFAWARGKKISVTKQEPGAGRRNEDIAGRLISGGYDEDLVLEDEKGETITVSKGNIKKVKLCVTLLK